MKKILFALVLLTASAFAATGVTITGTLHDASGAATAGKVVFLLVNIGSGQPKVPGDSLLAPILVTAQAAGDGTFSASLYGNYQITPANTFYQVTVFAANGAQVSIGAYQFNTAGSFDLSTLAQMVPSATPARPYIPVLTNPPGAQQIAGTIDVQGITVNGAPVGNNNPAGASLGLTKNGACAAGQHADGTYNGDGTPHCSPDSGGIGITAKNYGVHADTQFISDATLASGANTIDCTTTNDCNFTAADNGKVCFATSAQADTGENNSVVVLPQGVLTVTNAQHATCSGGNATGTYTHNAMFVWGTLDSNTAAGGSQTAGNDPLYGAWTAAATACQPLYLPAGVMLIERGEFNTTVSTSPCSLYPRAETMRQGYEVVGAGMASTILIPTPNFRAADCTAGENSNGCLFSAPNMLISELQVWGAGNSDPGAAFAGKVAVNMSGISGGNSLNGFIHKAIFLGWGANRRNFTGVYAGVQLSELWIDGNSIIEEFGDTNLLVKMNGNSFTSMIGGAICCNNGLDPTLHVAAGTLMTTNVGLGNFANGTSHLVDGGGKWYSTSDYTYGVTTDVPALTAVLGTGSEYHVTSGFLQTIGYGLDVSSGGTAFVDATTTISSSTASKGIFVGTGGTAYVSQGANISGYTIQGTLYRGGAASFTMGQMFQCDGTKCTTDNWNAAPVTTHSPGSGSYATSQNVTIAGCSGGTIYYSKNAGTVTAYSTPVAVNDGDSLVSRCELAHYNNSFPLSSTYAIGPTITDGFSGSNGTNLSTYNANWVYNNGTAALSSNYAHATSSYAAAHRSDGPNTTKQYAQALIVTLANSTGVIVHAAAAANTYYNCTVNNGNSLTMWKVVAGVFTNLGSTTITYADNLLVYADADVTAHTQHCKALSGTNVIGSVSTFDTTISSAGFPGILLSSDGAGYAGTFQAGPGTNH